MARAQAEISSAEFTEWVAYAKRNPFGPRRDDTRFGMLLALVCAAWGGKKDLAPADFFPYLRDEGNRASDDVDFEAIYLRFKRMAQMSGKIVPLEE